MPPTSTSTKAKYWILTIPQHELSPVYSPEIFAYFIGQLESGTQEGYLHWQCFGITKTQTRLSAIKRFFPTAHIEASRSEAAESYCQKDDTYVQGTRFNFGQKPFKRNSADDWGRVLDLAKRGCWDELPPELYIKHFRNLQAIAAQSATPIGVERTCYVFWGATGSGKSHRAWAEAGMDAYPKDPCTKFWCGYRGHKHVVLDEFRGSIGISHLLRWLDKYPVLVEVKGSSTVFKAEKIWITSNLHPKDWYPDLDDETKNALLRRLTITHFENPFNLNQ